MCGNNNFPAISGDNELIPAETAVSVLCSVEDDEVSEVLGFPLITKAEPYSAAHHPGSGGTTSPLNGDSSRHSWLVAAVVVTSILALVVFLAFLFLVHR